MLDKKYYKSLQLNSSPEKGPCRCDHLDSGLWHFYNKKEVMALMVGDNWMDSQVMTKGLKIAQNTLTIIPLS